MRRDPLIDCHLKVPECLHRPPLLPTEPMYKHNITGCRGVEAPPFHPVPELGDTINPLDDDQHLDQHVIGASVWRATIVVYSLEKSERLIDLAKLIVNG